MTTRNRIRRSIRRGKKNPQTFTVRNQRDWKAYDRWLSGILVEGVDAGNRKIWYVVPTGRGLIHKGGRP